METQYSCYLNLFHLHQIFSPAIKLPGDGGGPTFFMITASQSSAWPLRLIDELRQTITFHMCFFYVGRYGVVQQGINQSK